MKKTISIPMSRAVVFACLVMAFSVGAATFAQLRFDLLDRAEAKIVRLLHPHKTPAASLPSAAPVSAVLNVLALESRPPQESDFVIDASEDQAYLHSILDVIFPAGTVGLSDEEISIEILRYVTSSLKLKGNSGSATKILQEGYAICGGMSISFRALVRMAGIPARIVNIYGLISLGGHSMVEVYYDGQWHLFDPTFGLFFYSEPEYYQAGHIASLIELIGGSAYGWNIFKVVDYPWGGYNATRRSFSVVRAEEDYLSDFFKYPFLTSYRQMFDKTFPVAYDQNQVISFPVIADLTSEDSFSIGEVDNSHLDTIGATSTAETAGKAGMYYLQGSYNRQFVHTWFIKAPGPGLVRITYYSTQAEPPVLMLFPLKAVYVVDAVQEGSKAGFLLRISDPEAALQFWASDSVYWVDAMQAEWLVESIDPIETP